MKKIIVTLLSLLFLFAYGINSFGGTIDISPKNPIDGSGTSSFEINGYIGSYSFYNITIATTPHGKITANKSKAVFGECIELTIEPDSGYQLKEGSLTFNKKPIQGNSFYMPSVSVMIEAQFIPTINERYQVSIGSFSGGKITTQKNSYYAGELVELVLWPNSGYRLKADSLRYELNGIEYKISGTNFYMPAGDLKVKAEFEKYTDSGDEKPRGTIVILQSPGGVIKTDSSNPYGGDIVNIIVKPDDGYQLKEHTMTLTYTDKDGIAGDIEINGSSVMIPYTIENNSELALRADFITDEQAADQGQKLKYKIEVPDLSDIGYRVTASQYLALEGELINLRLIKQGAITKKISFYMNGKPLSGMSFFMPAQQVEITVSIEDAGSSVTPGVSIQSTVSLNHSFMVNPNLNTADGFTASHATFQNTSNVPLTYTMISMKAKNGPKISNEADWDWENLGKNDTMNHIALGFENDDKKLDFYFEEEGKQTERELFTLYSGDTDTIKMKAKYGRAWVESVKASYTCTIRIDIAV